MSGEPIVFVVIPGTTEPSPAPAPEPPPAPRGPLPPLPTLASLSALASLPPTTPPAPTSLERQVTALGRPTILPTVVPLPSEDEKPRPSRRTTVFTEAEFVEDESEDEEPEDEEEESDEELELDAAEPEPEPEPELPATKPTLLERGLALAQVGAEWVGALTQIAVQEVAKDIDKAMTRRRENDQRQYHLVVVKGKKSGEYLYVSGAEADDIERRLRKDGWHVLRTPI